jgi:hypothetical protein
MFPSKQPAATHPEPLLTENRMWTNWAILGQDAIHGQSPEPTGKVSRAGQRARLRDRTGTSRDLGQIDGLLRRCLRLQVSVDDQLEQACPVRLGGSVIARAVYW